MNKLEKYIKEHGLSEIAVMSLLCELGFISDNCVMASDVSDVDFDKANTFLFKGKDLSK